MPIRYQNGNRRAAIGENWGGGWYVIRSATSDGWDAGDGRVKLSVWDTRDVASEALARAIATDWIASAGISPDWIAGEGDL